MPPDDYEDPAAEERWCAERRAQVEAYLAAEGVTHRRIGEWPAWHVAPYVSLWAVESEAQPGAIGWWVICGDHPTDYVSAAPLDHPRSALAALARRWREIASCLQRGEPHPTVTLGSPEDWPNLAALLSTRAKILADWAEDDSLWEDDSNL